MMIETLDVSGFDKKVLDGSGETMVEFFATWCPHCQRMAPIVDELAGQLEGKVAVYRVDVDKSPALADKYAPNGYPTFVVFDDGTEVKDVSGEQSPEELLALVGAAA